MVISMLTQMKIEFIFSGRKLQDGFADDDDLEVDTDADQK